MYIINVFDAVLPWEFFSDGFSRKVHKLIFLKFKPKFLQNCRLQFFNQRVSRQQVQKFLILPENQTFSSPKLLAAFYSVDIFLLEKLLDSRTVPLVPSNGNLMGQPIQKLSFGLIRLAIQTLLRSKQQLSCFLPSGSQPSFPFLYKMLQYPYLLSFHLFKNLMSRKFCLSMMRLCSRAVFFQSYRLHFFIKTSIVNIRVFISLK